VQYELNCVKSAIKPQSTNQLCRSLNVSWYVCTKQLSLPVALKPISVGWPELSVPLLKVGRLKLAGAVQLFGSAVSGCHFVLLDSASNN